MSFDQFIKKLPNLRRATPADNERILAFMQQTSAQKRLTLHYDRSPDFSALLNLSSPDHFVLYYEGNQGIEGVISYTLIKSKDFDMLYVGDFKIAARSEDMKIQWRNFANDFIENIHQMDEFKSVKYIYMVMMDDNTKAYQRLITKNILSFNYKKVLSYKMINVIGQKWWKSPKAQKFSCTLTRATQENMSQLLTETAKNKLGSDHPDIINYRSKMMKPMATILEVKDQKNKIVLRASLEDVAMAKRIQIKRLPLALKLATMILPLFKGKSYSEGSPMEILYLSNVHFHCDRELMPAALSYAIKEALSFSKQRFHSVAISLFETEDFLIPEIHKQFFTQEEPLGYYQILPTWGEEIPREKLPNFNMSYI
jgi:hypothetical protein